MTMVIGLHSPVLGYCEAQDVVFVGDHLAESDCHHDCGHEELPAPVPCEEEHEFLAVDTGDFQWSPFHLDNPPVIILARDFICEPLLVLPTRKIFSMGLPEHDPPPPGLPIFRRNGVLRL